MSQKNPEESENVYFKQLLKLTNIINQLSDNDKENLKLPKICVLGSPS